MSTAKHRAQLPGTRRLTGVERRANWIAGVVLVVVVGAVFLVGAVALRGDTGVARDGLGEDTGPGSGCS